MKASQEALEWIDLSYRATNESYTSNIYFMGYYHNSLKIM